MKNPTPAQDAQQNNRDGAGQYQTKQNAEPLTGITGPYAAQRAAARPAGDTLFGMPLTPFEMGQRYDGTTLGSAIPVALENLDVNRDGFQDGLFKKMTGMENEFEFEVSYKATGVTRHGAVVLSTEVHIEPEEFEDLLTAEQHDEFLAGQQDRG